MYVYVRGGGEDWDASRRNILSCTFEFSGANNV